MLSEVHFDNISVSGASPSLAIFQQEVASSMARVFTLPPRDPQLDIIDTLANQRRTARTTNMFAIKKKLIASGNTALHPSMFATNLTAFEQRPFDGVTFKLLKDRAFQRTAWDENLFVTDYNALINMSSTKLTDNFVRLSVSAPVDWFDDGQWTNILHNTRILVKAALLGRCAGIWVDPEGYSANPWSYYDAIGRDDKTFEEFRAQVKLRGEEMMKAIETELPYPRLLFAFLMPATAINTEPDAPSSTIDAIKASIPTMRYGLLPAFVNGMLKGASPGTQLIDGNESAYYYRTDRQFTNFVHNVRKTQLQVFIDDDVKAAYTNQVRVGSSLYPNYYFGLHGRSLSQQMTEVERGHWYEHNVYYAMTSADEYVWDWLESSPDLWTTSWTNVGVLPPFYLSSIRNAQYKVTNGLSLEFSSSSLFTGTWARAEALRPTTTITNIALDQMPVIDGFLNDTIWELSEELSPFIRMINYPQTVAHLTHAKVCYDLNALYFAIQCMESNPSGLANNNSATDAYNVIATDNVHILVKTPLQLSTLNSTIYRFAINSAGTKSDACCYTNIQWNSATERFQINHSAYNPNWTAVAQINTNSWTVEVRIPWSELHLSPTNITNLAINIGRYRAQLVSERTYWGPVLEMQGDTLELMDPGLFGSLILK